MKKLLNNKFIMILGSTITLLVVLAVAMIFLTKENVKSFNQSGYIIASSKEDTTKYYFDEGTSYKTNINKQLVFTDTSGEKVNVETDNFLHYLNGGIKFLKNGVIMDLDSVNSTIVPYYNITNKSLLQYSSKSYYIETIDKTLGFNNLVGRISDNKYIVAGVDIKLQLAGNDKTITGDYFEITFIEDGVIKVENQEVSYQTTAENSYVLVNEDIKIDLGVKKVYYDDTEKMSLTQMTIDGNENIEIIPTEEEEEDKPQEDGTGTGTGGAGGTGTDGTQTPGDGTGDGSGSGDSTGTGNGGTGGSGAGAGEDTPEKPKQKASVEIVEAEVGANNISAKFYINNPDNVIEGDLVLHITNADTGKRAYSYKIDKTKTEFNFNVETLAPDANYILSINEEDNREYETQYFQKLFRTDNSGISLEKRYISTDSIEYEVVFEEDSPVKSVKINLYNDDYTELKGYKVIDRNDTIKNFDNLTSDTSYNLVLDNMIIDNIEFEENYTIYETVKTLKETPSFDLKAEVGEDSFTIGIENVVGGDSITKYKYIVYNADEINLENRDNMPVVYESPEIKDATKVNEIKLNIDNKKIFAGTNYKFKVVAEYYDNEKFVEFASKLSDSFLMAERPSVKFEESDTSSFEEIVGNIVITDDNCTIPIIGRTCSSRPNYANDFKLAYYDSENPNQLTIIDDLEFVEVDKGKLQTKNPIAVDKLKPEKTYMFELYGDVDLLDGKDIRKGYQIGTFSVNTIESENLTVETWLQNDTGVEDLINVTTKIVSVNSNDRTINSLRKITFNLYAGDVVDRIKNGELGEIKPIKTVIDTTNLKEKYYKKDFRISTLETFGFVDSEITTEEGTLFVSAIDLLKAETNGQLPEYYTIEIIGVIEENGENKIENNLFKFTTSPRIRIEQNEMSPEIYPDQILNSDLNLVDENGEKLYDKEFDEELFNDTIVGYKLRVDTNLNTLKKYFSDVNQLIYYVCDADKNPDCTMANAIFTLPPINLKKESTTEAIVYLESGTPYDVEDTTLTRGHNYIFKAKFAVGYSKQNADGVIEEVNDYYPSYEVRTLDEAGITPKQDIMNTYSIYIDKTTGSEVYYKYSFKDIDNALYDNKFYYTVNDSEIKTYDFSEENPFVIDNLTKNSFYDISFKRALIKNKANIEDILVGKYVFDGEYVYSEEDVTFELKTHPNDNRLKVLILESEANKHLVDRISAYQITLSADGLDDYVRVFPAGGFNPNKVNKEVTDKITTCTIGEGETAVEYKCIIIDYKNLDENGFKNKDITVKLTAFYDSGIINNDFANLSSSDIGYILQSNNVFNPDKINPEKMRGSYIYVNDAGGITVSEVPYGIYEYKGNTTSLLQIERKIDNKNFVFKTEPAKQTKYWYETDSIYIKDSGDNNLSINNKLLSKVDLGTEDNSFKFKSYIPKITVSDEGLIDGSTLTITPSGLNDEILRDEFQKESDDKYYYYLEIYDPEGNYLRDEKLELSTGASAIKLTKYLPNTTYTFKVYAYMLKNDGYVKTYLFDADNYDEYEISTYSFSTLTPTEIGYNNNTSINVEYASKSGNNYENVYTYSMRDLTITYNTNNNIGDFDVKFELYDINNSLVYEETVEDAISGKSYDIYKKVIDITNDPFVFGNGYYTLKIYTLTEQYDNTEKYVFEVYNNKVNLNQLQAPIIDIEREEITSNKLSFKVSVDDKDKVIKDGTYCVQLKSSRNADLPEHPARCGYLADKKKELITFEGLNPDTTYIFKVYTDIYRNNVGYTEEEKENDAPGEKLDVLSTSTDYGISLGTFAAFSNSTGTSVTLSFSSGYNVTSIKKIDFTIMETSGQLVFNETYAMGVDKYYIVDGNNVKVVMEPTKLKEQPLQRNKSYYAVVSFYIEKDGELIPFTEEERGIEFN